MAKTFTFTKLSVAGINRRYSGGKTLNKSLVASCVGPATSVSDGMTINLGSHFTYAYTGWVKGRMGTVDPDIEFHFEPASNWAAATPQIVAIRRSTGNLLSAAVDLSGARLIMEFQGDD